MTPIFGLWYFNGLFFMVKVRIIYTFDLYFINNSGLWLVNSKLSIHVLKNLGYLAF